VLGSFLFRGSSRGHWAIFGDPADAGPNPMTDDERKVEAALAEIRQQCDDKRNGPSGYVPEIGLMFAVFELSVKDAVFPGRRNSRDYRDQVTAANYLLGTMPHLQYAGVNAHWARYVLRRHGVWDLIEASG